MFLEDKVNGDGYIAQVVELVLLQFLPQESDVLSRQDNARPHTAAVTERALRGLELPWRARSPDLSPIEHLRDMMKLELTPSPETVTTIALLRQRVQDAWDSLSQDDIRHLYDRLHSRIQACVVARGSYTVYRSDCLGSPYCGM